MFLSKTNEFYTVQHGKVVGSAETGEKRAKYPVSIGKGKGRIREKESKKEKRNNGAPQTALKGKTVAGKRAWENEQH